MNSLDLYKNYLYALEYGDSKDLIEMYERELMERYKIKIKTKEGTYEYEKEDLSNIDILLEKHREEEGLEVYAEKMQSSTKNVEEGKCKKKVLKTSN